MRIVVNFLAKQQIESYQAQIVGVYRDAFAAPPYGKGEAEIAAFAQSLPEHMRRESFRFVAALEDPAERMVGLAYGYTSLPGQWWYDQVVSAVSPQIAAKWLTNCFQLVEIAVTPQSQGQGIGGLLHDRLLGGLPQRKAVLSTLQAETRAQLLYRRRGWVVLRDNLLFPGVQRPYQIIGLDLSRIREGADSPHA